MEMLGEGNEVVSAMEMEGRQKRVSEMGWVTEMEMDVGWRGYMARRGGGGK
jgi:hypothetical protein